jgi:hypothetical protein
MNFQRSSQNKKKEKDKTTITVAKPQFTVAKLPSKPL